MFTPNAMIAEIRPKLRIVSATVQLWNKPTARISAAMTAIEDGAADERAHTTFPLNIPVGRTSSTTTRMMNDTANL